MKNKNAIRRTPAEIVFTIINTIFMVFVMATILYPFLNVAAIAFNDGVDAMRGGIHIWPRKFSLIAIKTVFEHSNIMIGMFNSIARTLITTPLALISTAGLAFILARKDLIGRRVVMFFFVFTMYFGGGMVPTYLLIRDLGLLDTFLVYIMPNLLGVYNMMLIRAYFEELPASVAESARIDGANEMVIFSRLMLPMAKPVLATVALFTAVGQWNGWYDTYIYTSNENLITLQGILIGILKEAQANMYNNDRTSAEMIEQALTVTPESIKNATILITTLPIIMIYPFLQKYFVKGVMLGAVKG